MSNTPEGNICKVSANLGWASDTLAMVDKTMLKLSAEVKTILRERDNFQDQRDFAMNEIERLRKERDEALAERDEWIARFRADEQLIKDAMIPHPANPEP